MKHIFYGFVAIVVCVVIILGSQSIFAAALEQDTIHFFFSPTCPHCQAEMRFLENVRSEHPSVAIREYPIVQQESQRILFEALQAAGMERYFGAVPITIINGEIIPGFDSADGVVGRRLSVLIEDIADEAEISAVDSSPTVTTVPSIEQMRDRQTIAGIDISSYSLPLLAVLLGFFDGFNVCSLGALLLILGLVISLRSRRAIVVYGGAFIVTTAVIYGLLIYFWHALFSTLSSYLAILEMLIAGVGVLGGAYFFKEFIRLRKKGATCSMEDNRLILFLNSRLQNVLEAPGRALSVVGFIILFSAAITIIEFPCSAAVPLAFAGILADAHMGSAATLAHISLFVLMYMLDELIVFGVSIAAMRLWIASGRTVIWATLLEAVILSGIGIYYLARLLSF